MTGYDAGMTGVLSPGVGIYKVDEETEDYHLIVSLLEADEGILGYSNLGNGETINLDPFNKASILVYTWLALKQ